MSESRRWKIAFGPMERVVNPVTGELILEKHREEEFVGEINYHHGVLLLSQDGISGYVRAYAPGQWLKVERILDEGEKR